MLSFKYISDVCKQKRTILLQIIMFNPLVNYWYCSVPLSNRNKALMKNVAYNYFKQET